VSNYGSFIQKLLPGQSSATPPAAIPSLEVKQPAAGKTHNPFMIAHNPENPQFMGYYGVNRPLKEPMFMGYRDNKPLMGGGRLFILS
jgi:hypothetical protein